MADDLRAILNPLAGIGRRFTLQVYSPCEALAAFVERYWIVRWDLEQPFEQETLPHPVVNVVLGEHQPGVWGPQTERFVASLDGAGWVIGAKFRPGGFHPFYKRDIAELAERTLPVAALFDVPSLDPSSERRLVDAMQGMLVAKQPIADDQATLATRAVELARDDPQISRATMLAERLAVSSRTIERLFRRYVGVSPKWVVRRYRVHEACERVKTGVAPDWSQLAHELGYFDQAHFIHDFKAQVGRTPADYAAACASARSASARDSPIATPVRVR
jgi:AraC-like DNA-binding protein